MVREILKGRSFDFGMTALEVFSYQYTNNPVYKQWCDGLARTPGTIEHFEEIPFLPVEVFRNHKVLSKNVIEQEVFISSGTTSENRSRHYVADLDLYRLSARKAFERIYGPLHEKRILCLLPSYVEAGHSSLVFMCQYFVSLSDHPESGFYHQKENELIHLLNTGSATDTLLIGVTYALLDLFSKESSLPANTTIIETGGMKGRRKEMTREELHGMLTKASGIRSIHSEYGMTELLSQAYSTADALFEPPPWMRVLIREPDDPFQLMENGRRGLINIIDLANIHSCSFIATQDIGRKMDNERFTVEGRSDNSDIRGCNLLIQ